MPKSSIAIRTPSSLIGDEAARGLLDVAHQRRLGDLDRQRLGLQAAGASAPSMSAISWSLSSWRAETLTAMPIS